MIYIRNLIWNLSNYSTRMTDRAGEASFLGFWRAICRTWPPKL
jgi:hypothetical protein